MTDTEHILCAAIYVDTGKAEPPRRSFTYPETGLVFAACRHGDCFTTMNAWADGLTDEEQEAIKAISEYALKGEHQGFLTSLGRFVDRQEAAKIAKAAGQTSGHTDWLMSEDLY